MAEALPRSHFHARFSFDGKRDQTYLPGSLELSYEANDARLLAVSCSYMGAGIYQIVTRQSIPGPVISFMITFPVNSNG
eukprot:scaffold4743_cov171-Amphora_coffeaeformis.AAC.8